MYNPETGIGKSALVKDLQAMRLKERQAVRLGKLHACLLTRRSCQDLVGYCERHGLGKTVDELFDSFPIELWNGLKIDGVND